MKTKGEQIQRQKKTPSRRAAAEGREHVEGWRLEAGGSSQFWRAEGLSGHDKFERGVLRCSRLKIAAVVRENNWTEEQLRCKWLKY